MSLKKISLFENVRANPKVKLVPWYNYVRIHTKGSNKPSVPQALKKRKKKRSRKQVKEEEEEPSTRATGRKGGGGEWKKSMNAEGEKSLTCKFPPYFSQHKKVKDIYFSELSRLHIRTKNKMQKGKGKYVVFFSVWNRYFIWIVWCEAEKPTDCQKQGRKTQEVLKERGFQNQRKVGIKETAALWFFFLTKKERTLLAAWGEKTGERRDWAAGSFFSFIRVRVYVPCDRNWVRL